MDDGLYLPYLGSRYTFYLPYLPVRFMDPVCEQGINLEKSNGPSLPK